MKKTCFIFALIYEETFSPIYFWRKRVTTK